MLCTVRMNARYPPVRHHVRRCREQIQQKMTSSTAYANVSLILRSVLLHQRSSGINPRPPFANTGLLTRCSMAAMVPGSPLIISMSALISDWLLLSLLPTEDDRLSNRNRSRQTGMVLRSVQLRYIRQSLTNICTAIKSNSFRTIDHAKLVIHNHTPNVLHHVRTMKFFSAARTGSINAIVFRFKMWYSVIAEAILTLCTM